MISARSSIQLKKVSELVKYTLYAVTLLLVNTASFGFPLTTDDTGTLAQGRSKIELNNELSDDLMNGASEVSVSHEIALIHGLRDNLSGFVNLPYRDVSVREADGNRSNKQGFGDAKIGLKWRFLTQGSVSVGVKAAVTVPVDDTAKRLGNGQPAYSVNTIASYEATALEYHLNIGYTWLPNTFNQREWLENISAAMVLNLNSSWKVMADIGVAGNKDKATSEMPAYFGVGLSYKLNQDLTLDIGLKHGLSAVETDNTGLVGVSWVF